MLFIENMIMGSREIITIIGIIKLNMIKGADTMRKSNNNELILRAVSALCLSALGVRW